MRYFKMKKKTIGILLIMSLVMIMCIGAISAADTNDTLQAQISDTDTATEAVALEDNVTSLESEAGSDVEINANDNSDEISDGKVKAGASSNAGEEVLSASDDDLLGENPNFYYAGKWYGDLDDAVDDACDNNGGTIYLKARAWGYDSAEREITISDGVWLTFQPYNSGDEVIFDGQKNTYWFFKIDDKDAHITFNDITFRNGGDGSLASDGGAIRIIHGSVTFNNCIFDNNEAGKNIAGGFGWGGAIFLDESDASLIANNCRFTNNKADNGGGAVCAEDDASATFNNCYFEGNTAPDGNNVLDKDGGSHTFNNCRFIGSGSLDIVVDAPAKTVHITPDVNDDVNYAVLYKGGNYYDRKPCNDGDTATFSNLERGTYTVYMMKNWEAKYEYSGNAFSIMEPNFVLDGDKVFETLSAAVNAIPNGGTGEITVEGGIYTGSANFNVQIINKRVTICPKDTNNPVTFSGSSQSYLFDVGSNAQLTMEDITITGKFSDIALKFLTNQVCTISDCEFKNIKNTNNQPERPIFAQNSNLVLSGDTFESSSRIVFGNTVVKIDDCTFTSNVGINGGAIYADSSSDVTITNSKFTDNEGTGSGGAIYANKLKIHDTTFMGNSANRGGAIYIASGSNDLVNITNCVFDYNYATNGYRNIYSESTTRKINLQFNEYDLNLKIDEKDGSYGMDYILDGVFDWGSNLDNNYTVLAGIRDDENLFGDLLTIKDNQFKISMGVLSGGTHEFAMEGMYTQGDSNDHFYLRYYYSDLYGNEFYLNKAAYAKIVIEKAKIILTLDVKDVLIPETPVLNVRANWDNNYTIIIGNKNYQLEVVNGKASMPLTGLDLGNYTVVGMRDGDVNYYMVMNFTTFSISKTYSNFLVLSTNVEYDTLKEAVANSNNEDSIFIKNGTYKETGIVISDKTLDIIALEGAVFDAQGGDANFITVNKNAGVYICGITFRGLHNRNTNYGAIVNHGDLSLDSCNFTDNKITKTSFAQNGGAAIFSDGESLDIDNCNFINNVAPLKVSTAAVTSVGYEDVSIASSNFINNSAREGGALHFKNISQFESAVSSCEFEQNTAVKGSAIYVGNNSRYLSVTLSSFKKNDIKNSLGENAQLEGGVIYVNANTSEVIFDVSLSNFEDNSNRQVDGGVICLDGISRANIESSIFSNNNGKLGSVILIKNPQDKKLFLSIDSSGFIDNHATNGAIATSPKVTTFIDECLFANNTGENRHIYSNGFTIVHDSIFEVRDAKLNALSVQYGESSTINGTVDIGTNIYATANLTIANENTFVEIKNNTFSYKTGILDRGKYSATLNGVVDANGNTYLMESITEIFRVNAAGFDLNVSVDNITYGETLTVVENLPQTVTGTVDYQLNGRYYTKEEIESLILDAGKYTLVAIYNHEDYSFASSTVNFEVYKANPTITVDDVEVEYGDNIILKIESNVPSIYTIEIEDYKTAVFVNGSRSVKIEKTFEPGDYTVKVTSQERVNYKSNSTEANLKVNVNSHALMLSVSDKTAHPDESLIKVSALDNAAGDITYTVSDSNKNIVYTMTQSCSEDLTISGLDAGTYEIKAVLERNGRPLMTSNNLKLNLNNENIRISPDDNKLGEDYGEGKFIFQYDEDSDYEYYDTLEEAIDEVVTWGAGIITVRGGIYSGDGFRDIVLEGELELTIKAFEGEEVIFDCGNEGYFLHLTYETEVYPIETPPFIETEQTEGPTVTLDKITVIRGSAINGGAIDLDAGTLILANCTFSNNNAACGGAIYIGSSSAENEATVMVYNTTFTNNTASEGGAIYIEGGLLQDVSATFYLCTFLDNYQGEEGNYTLNYFGGADVNEITKQYCIFNGVGEIYSVVIDKINQTVTVNGTSPDVFDSVVLLYFDQAPLYSIYNNGSRDFYVTFEDVIGGNYTLGVMNDHDFNTYIFENKFEMKVPNFIISEDEVYENLTDAIDAVAENGIIYANANYYTEDNMEIVINKSFTLKNFRDRDVVFDGCGEKWFFTIAEGKTVVFDGIYFTDGGVKGHASIENYGTLIINNCSFESFETGEIIYNSGLLNILNTTFSMNSVNDALVWNDKDLFIDTVEFSYNIVNTSSVVYTNGVAEIISSNFTDNFNLGNGGAINNAKSLSVKDTVFNENEGLDGGAIYSTGILEVLNCTFEDNTANGYGGAIYNGGEANIFNSTFTGASSEKDGGAIYNNDKLAVDNSTFVGDTATGNGGAIYNNKSSVITKSLFGINFAEECANIYNAGDIQFSDNIFDFYDVILIVPDGEYGIPTTITGTLNPEFNMDIQVLLPGFVNNKDASVIISDGVFEYVTDILPRGTYDVILDEVIYDGYGNIYYGEAITDRLIIHKANVYINLTVDDVVIRGETGSPVLKISASKDGLVNILFNNKFSNVTITGGQATVTLDAVGEGKYSVLVVREGDENYNDAANQTTFKVSKYEGNFIVNSTGNQFETLREALADTSNDDVIYVMEGTYSSADNLGLTISNKKLTIISLGDVVFDANSTDLRFLTVDKTADVTLCDVVLIGFNAKNKEEVILNKGNFTFDGCTITKYNWVSDAGGSRFIDSEGNLNIIDSEFYDNVIYTLIHATDGEVIINGSEFENNTIKSGFISLHSLNSAKIISNVFAENIISEQDFLFVSRSKDVFINSEFYNNQCDYLILAYSNTNMLVNNSIFIGNTVKKILRTNANDQSIISESVFTNNTAENVVLSSDKKLSVLESTFSDNTLSDNGALNIASGNAIVNGSIFSNNKANNYRNIYSASSNVNITNSVFDALNVDYTVYDIDYGQTETIEGSIDIGTNLKFAVNLDINNKIYSVNVTNNGFTFNSGVLNGGDYNVVLNPKDNNSNTFVFDKITKIFTVKRVDPGLSISIADITEGEKLKVNMTISKNITARVVYELNGNTYNKNQLENLTLKAGNYLITAMYRGDKNYLAATDMVNVKVHKIAPNITVSDAVVNYTDEIKINVTVDVADYYTVFIGNESVSLYVKDNATFTFPSEEFKPGSYEIIAYVFESDDYAEAYGYANLTVNKAATGVFNLSDDLIDYGENATISVEVPVNAYGNIAYKVYDENMELVYNITQSCLDELVVPNLRAGRYTVTGAFEGDSYYTNDSTVNSGVIYVNPVIAIIVSDITYGENVTVTIETDIDGEYLVYVGNESNVVTVKDGVGNVTVSDLTVGSYVVNVTAVDGNYSAFNETVFDVALKSISAIVSVGNIIYGEEAIVTVYGEVDGEYIVEIYNQNYTVNVADGKGNTTISDLVVGEDILASVSIADGNYSAYNTTTFNVVPKQIPVIISVGDTQYGEDALVTVQADVDGDYTVNIRDVNYTVSVDGGKGVKLIHNLDVGEDILASVSIADGNYSAYNTTTFNVILKKNTTIDAVAKVNGNKVTVTVTVDENATGYIGLTQAGLTMFVALENGVATYTDTVPAGSYNVEVTYTGDYYFNENSTRVLFTVVEFTKDNTPISIDVSTVENNVTYTVNVNHDASGIVRFEVSGAAEYVVYADVLDGVAVMGDVLEAGDYTVVATYMGDNRFNTNVTLENFTVKGHVKKDTPISASASVNGNKVTITVTVDENATGFIGLTESGSTFYVALVNGVATYTDAVPAGSYNVEVTYTGDGNFNGNSTIVLFTVVEAAKENTTIDVDVSSVENNVTYTVNVDSNASGIVRFEVSGAAEYVVYADIINGVAVMNDLLEAGDYTVIATYLGDDRFNANVTSESFTVRGHVKKDTPISASASVNGNKVTITVTVDENATGFIGLTESGSTFYVALVNGVATYTDAVPAGSYNVEVTYTGDGNFNGNSTIVLFTVVEAAKENTTIDVDVDVVENNVTYTVNVDSNASGIVRFEVSGALEYVVYADVLDGVAVMGDALVAGDYTVVATYMGDDRFNSNVTSESFTVRGHVKKDTPITADAKVNGNKVTITVSVDENATGFIGLKQSGLTFYVALENGMATYTDTVPAGSYNVEVIYTGDGNFNGNSTRVLFTVVEAVKDNTPISIDVSSVENNVTYMVNLNPDATGIVRFEVSGALEYVVYADVLNGKAVMEDVLKVGDYTVVATYMGDNRFNSNVTSESFTVKGHVKKDTPISADAKVNGNKVTITVSVDENATGFIGLTESGSTFYVALVNGVATYTDAVPAGSYNVEVTYTGDGNFNGNSTIVLFTVVEAAKENTTIDVDVSSVENNVTYTVNVDSNASGIVRFEVSGAAEYVVYANIINGVAVMGDVLVAGDYTVVATYLGDDRFNTNVTSERFTVKGHIKKDTPISADAKVNGNKVTITVTVDENATGFIGLKESGSTFYVALVNGVATYTDTLLAGSYNVEVIYTGDDNFNENSTKLSFTVEDPVKENTPISVDVSSVENNVTYTVNVDSNASGIVRFDVSGTLEYVVYADVLDGVAVMGDVLVAGDYTVVATYLGDDRFNSNVTSESFTVKGHVKEDTPVSADAKVNGNKVTITVNVNENATGFVGLTQSGLTFYVALVNGVATYTDTVPAGSYNIKVTYAGDDNFNGNSTRVLFTVVEAVKDNTPISVDVSSVENNVTYMVNLNPDATGIVRFDVSGALEYVVYADVLDGVAVMKDMLEAGDYTVVATYMGDDRFNSNVTFESFTVKGHVKNDTPISADVKVNRHLVTITVNVNENATGIVKFIVTGAEEYALYVDVVGGKAVLEGVLESGNYTLVAAYMGDDRFNENVTFESFTVYVPEKQDTNVSITVPSDIKVGDNVTVEISVPNATGNVSVFVDGVETVIPLDENGNASVHLDNISAGEHSIFVVYTGDDTHEAAYKAIQLSLKVMPTQFTNITVFGDQNITAVLADEEGNPIANAVIDYLVGSVAGSTVTGADGSFIVAGENGTIMKIRFAGNDALLATEMNVELSGVAPVVPPVSKVESRFNITGNSITLKGYAIDKRAGEIGMTYATELVDINGNPIPNAYIEFAINDKIHNRTTYENGSFLPYELNMLRAGRYTLAFSFGGNDQYNNAFAVVCIDLDKKPITIKASAKTYKASAKTRKYTVTLSTIPGSSADGKAHLRAGLTVTMQINGKTYNRLTNSKGQVSFYLQLTKKGIYNAKISYAGDQTYCSASKSVKITVK